MGECHFYIVLKYTTGFQWPQNGWIYSGLTLYIDTCKKKHLFSPKLKTKSYIYIRLSRISLFCIDIGSPVQISQESNMRKTNFHDCHSNMFALLQCQHWRRGKL